MGIEGVPISTAITKLIEEGDRAASAEQFALASAKYREAIKTLSSNPQARATCEVLEGQATLCEGLQHFYGVDGHMAALIFFERAIQHFKSGGYREGMLRAEGFLNMCKAVESASDEDFEDAVAHYLRARAGFARLAQVPRASKVEFDKLCLVIDIEVAVLQVMDDLSDRDFDGARSGLADGRRAQMQLIELLPSGQARSFYEAYLQFADGLWSYVKGQFEVSLFRIPEGRECLRPALEKFKQAKAEMDKSGPMRPRGPSLSQMFEGLRLKCEGDLRAADSTEAMFAGRCLDAVKAAREAAGIYDQSSATFAAAGALGFAGLYDAAEERDRLRSLADVLSRSRLSQANAVPEFAIFVKDDALARALERDFREILFAYQAGAWKLAIIGCGSVLEALLLCTIQGNWIKVQLAMGLPSASVPQAAESWNLERLIDATSRARLISRGVEHFSDALRDFRNLVHPSKEMRGRYIIDEAAAVASMSAMEVIVKELRVP